MQSMDILDLVQRKLGTAGLVASSAATLLVGAVFSYHLSLSFRRSGEAPIRWSWLPILGNALDLGVRPLEFLSECTEAHSDIFGMVVAGNRMFIIADVESCNVVLKPPKCLTWEEFHDIVLSNFFGANFSQDGMSGVHSFDENLMRKWYSNYLLSDSALGTLTTRMQAQLAKDVNATATGREVALYEFISKLVFQASVASLFSPEAAEDPDLFEAFRAFDQHMPMAAGGYKVDYAAGPKKARAILLKAVRKYQSERNCEFIRKRFQYFDGLTSAANTESFQLAMLWASVGNTMPAVFWLMFYLITNPDAMEKAQAELRAECPSSCQGQAEFPQEQLNRLLYLDACITETLRMCSGSMIMRHVKEACEVTLASGKSYRFRKGDRVGLCPPLWHRDAELYPEPFQFRPARWVLSEGEGGETPTTEEAVAASQGKIRLSKGGKVLPSGMGYLPFGGGVTLCPGRRFARNEVKTLVVCLLAQFRFQLADGANAKAPEFDGARAGLGIFPPKSDVRVRISAP